MLVALYVTEHVVGVKGLFLTLPVTLFILGLIGSRIKDRKQTLVRREDYGFHIFLTLRGHGLGDL